MDWHSPKQSSINKVLLRQPSRQLLKHGQLLSGAKGHSESPDTTMIPHLSYQFQKGSEKTIVLLAHHYLSTDQKAQLRLTAIID